jgi:peptide/nickel transport system permease protein
MSNENRSFSRAAWRRLRKNKGAMLGLIIICLSVIIALFAYFIAPDSSPYANRIILEAGGEKPGYTQQFVKLRKEKNVEAPGFFQQLIYGKEDPYLYIPITQFEKVGDSIIVQKNIDEGLTERQVYTSPQTAIQPVTTLKFFLGTDKYGRDILSRLIVGTRVSLSVGLITAFISVIIGVFFGSLAGYFSGRTDNIIMWFINIIWSIPTLLLVFAITLVLGKGFWQVFVAVGLTMWVNVARLVRGQILSVRELE